MSKSNVIDLTSRLPNRNIASNPGSKIVIELHTCDTKFLESLSEHGVLGGILKKSGIEVPKDMHILKEVVHPKKVDFKSV